MKEAMATMLRKLRLSGAAETLEVRCQEARSNSLSHEEFLELVLQDEILIRKEWMVRGDVYIATSECPGKSRTTSVCPGKSWARRAA